MRDIVKLNIAVPPSKPSAHGLTKPKWQTWNKSSPNYGRIKSTKLNTFLVLIAKNLNRYEKEKKGDKKKSSQHGEFA